MTPAQPIYDRVGRMTLLSLAVGAIVCGLLLASGPALVTCTRSSAAMVTILMRDTHGLHLAIMGGCAAVGAVVVGWMLYSIGTFPLRKSTGTGAFHAQKVVELVWALIPVAILIGMATPAVREFLATTAAAPAQVSNPGYRCELGLRIPS